MSSGGRGGLAEGRRPGRHRLICPCLTSSSVVLWPGTLTPTTTRQEAVTSFYLQSHCCFPRPLLIASYAKQFTLALSSSHVFWFCFFVLLHINSKELSSAQTSSVWQAHWSSLGLNRPYTVTSQWLYSWEGRLLLLN